MSRFFDLKLYPDGETVPLFEWTTHPNGQFNPNYPQIEFDIPTAAYSVPAATGGAALRIHGVQLSLLSQNSKFAQVVSAGQMNYTLEAGMAPGLPLANPLQSGLISSGFIYQAFGNWEGTNQTLDLLLYGNHFDEDNQGNIVLNWQQGQSLYLALKQTLSTAFPDYQLDFNIDPYFIAESYPVIHACGTLEGFAQFILRLTKGKNNPNYPGVSIALRPSKSGRPTIAVWDNVDDTDVVPIAFKDMIGQPTWVSVDQLQVKCPMRADIQMGTMVSLPKEMQNIPSFALANSASNPSSIKYQSTFAGDFQCVGLRHIGNSRDPNPNSWISVIDMVTA